MIKIKISNNAIGKKIIRQTPSESGLFGNCEFFINEDIEECDYWIVYDGLLSDEKVICPKENTILVTGEPSTVKSYNRKFINQFAQIITCQKELKHKSKVITQQALPWHIGRKIDKTTNKLIVKTYDEFKKFDYNKTKLISVICSNKAFTVGHKRRLDFVMKLKDYFGDQIDIFGRGINDIDDKWEAIADYKYHISIENNVCPHYWTEKLADCYLGEAYPFYYGCPNLTEYFDEKSFSFINIDDFDESIKIIENAVSNDLYEKSKLKILEAKDLVLDKYNLFAMISEIASENYVSGKKKKLIKIKPESHFFKKKKSLFSKLWSKTKN